MNKITRNNLVLIGFVYLFFHNVAVCETQTVLYKDNKDGTVTDIKNHLMWKKCSEGVKGANCQQNNIDNSQFLWSETSVLTKQTLAGYSDWRLPTLAELHTLVRCANNQPSDLKAEARGCAGIDGADWGHYAIPTINTQFFPNVPEYATFWTATPIANKPGANWLIDFNSGGTNFAYKNNTNRKMVRLVRIAR